MHVVLELMARATGDPGALGNTGLAPALAHCYPLYPKDTARILLAPPQVSWRYDWAPEPGTPEARLYTDFMRPRDWADETPTGLWL